MILHMDVKQTELDIYNNESEFLSVYSARYVVFSGT